MMDIFIEMISYPFMVRAIIVGCLVSLCASLLGTSLVLKRYSMIGDGLSHVGFAALAIAYAFHAEPLTIRRQRQMCIRDSSPAERQREDQRRLCHGSSLQRRSCHRRHDDFLKHRNEYRRVQLHVRQHPCHERR